MLSPRGHGLVERVGRRSVSSEFSYSRAVRARSVRGWKKLALRCWPLLTLPCLAAACEPKMVVGALECSPEDGGAGGAPDGRVLNDGALRAPWSTSFDDGFCGYHDGTGFCYSDPKSSYRLVTAPVRTGAFAAAFEIHTDVVSDSHQARCVREGALPEEAYYGAWYYIPSGFSRPDNWNLLHFQGGEPGTRLRGLWDVSLEDGPDGQPAAYVRDILHGRVYSQDEPVAMPTEQWVHLELYLKRSSEPTGEVVFYQDDVELIRITDIVTDNTPFGQWYVGNLAGALSPPDSTVYVDDVTIRLSR